MLNLALLHTQVKGKKAEKPAWALSTAEVEGQKEAEEAELLAFAEELDFDAFMASLDDAELKETLQVCVCVCVCECVCVCMGVCARIVTPLFVGPPTTTTTTHMSSEHV